MPRWPQTIAEFVGDEATVTLLWELGVNYAQGYFIGAPVALDSALRAVASSNRLAA